MKKLVPNTIIPENLYVDRVADQQLSAVINDMGRPGYILVARQMGKTNLLINAKKKLESPEDIFAYIDLSNRYDTDRECFRSIIDTILESNYSRMESVADEIYSDRELKTTTSHREHSRELRKILQEIKGKLIIILDEIDSLTSASYSDKIFAHVRSIYFERINFKEYERLSYIISGVAEPSEIIKDKSISPFNIGQKILLGDFSYSEFESFIDKTGLKFSESVIKRVFYWCNGNPRLTWEVCSALEDMSLNYIELNEVSVDKTVEELYLTKFDRPPVDHIRSLVESEKELREAIITIIYGKSDVLSDRIKNKLYLSGILGSDYEYGNVKIKNKIIEQSLDENWLYDLAKADNLSQSKAEELLSEGKYSEALHIFEYLAKQQGLDKLQKMNFNYKLGICYYNTLNYSKVIECYQDAIFDKDGYRDMHMDQLYTLGMSHLRLDENKSALGYFETIINDEKNPFYHEALINKAAILVRTGGEKEKQQAIAINEMIIRMHTDGVHVNKHAISGAYYNVAVLNEAKNSKLAVENYLKSAESADGSNNVTPLISAISLNPTIIDDYLVLIIQSLSSGNIRLDSTESKSGIELTSVKLGSLIGLLFEMQRFDDLEQILSLIKDNCFLDKSNYSSAILEVVALKMANSNNSEAKYLLNQVVGNSKEFSTPDSLFICNKFLSFIDSGNEKSREIYLKGFQNYVEVCDVMDVRIFERIITGCMESKEFQRAVGYCDLIIDNEGLNSNSNKLKFFTVIFLKMQSTDNIEERVEQARIIIEIADHIEQNGLSVSGVDVNTIGFIKRQAQIYVFNRPIQTFIRPDKKYGRNEKLKIRYEDGREELVKYKLVRDSILNGKCKVV
jgi:tetratricopeptide (TPR) repeat protein